ncbi:hypothetical protein AB0O31_13800 [Kitasatospora cineracea]|uniref:hypothetical protein n=1 Tax=Kitasatospora cineracea TaxID=88074 RepID=UPI0034194843
MPTTQQPGPGGGPGRTDSPAEGPAPAGKTRRPRPVRNALLLLLAAAAVLGGVLAARPLLARTPKSAAPPAPAPESSAPPGRPTPEHPWAGSPAEPWPVGAAGIAMPDRTPATGVFDEQQVAANLAAVKAYLVAANLDPQVMAGGGGQQALDLMQPKDADLLSQALAHPDSGHDPANWLSRFDPAWAVPATGEVKVQGRVDFESDGDHGMLVHTDVTFVYALRPGPEAAKPVPDPNGGGYVRVDASRLVDREIVRRVQDFRFYDPKRYRVTPGRPAVASSRSEFGNNRCELGSGYLQPQFLSLRAGAGDQVPTGPATDPYDRTGPLPDTLECQSASRT